MNPIPFLLELVLIVILRLLPIIGRQPRATQPIVVRSRWKRTD